MSILLTGFDPFGGADVNPSWEAVCRVPNEIAGQPVFKRQLPTVFGEAAALLEQEIARLHPDFVLCCGVASGRKAVTPELVAINYRMGRIADNAGQVYAGEPIVPQGDAAYMTGAPIHQTVEALREAGIPAAISLSAGAYVCNDVYYALLRYQAQSGYRGLFVHVPDADVVSFEEAARALTICLKNCIEP